jgi:putative ABC transport system permease protein
MMALALRSLRYRPAAATATFLSVLLGTALIGSFAMLLQTGIATSGSDRTNLMIMGGVVGGWGAIIVLYSVAATVGITAAGRVAETGLLRTIGATSRQVRRLVGREGLAVSLAAAVAGCAVAAFGGRALFLATRDGGLVTAATPYRGGLAALGATALLVVLTSAMATTIAGRRATSRSAAAVLREAETEPRRMHWWRTVVGLLCIAYGIGGGVVTVTVGGDFTDPYYAMATCGSSSILVGIGLALLAPWLLRRLVRPIAGVIGWSPSGYLAGYNAVRRPHLLAGVLAPVIVLVAEAVGTVMLVSIDDRTVRSTDPDVIETGRVINLLNYVVTGMISLFAVIMVVTAFAAVIARRRPELRRLHLAGATRGQLTRSVVAEAGIVAVVGVLLGGLASLATIVPFSIVRHEGLVPDGGLWLAPTIAVVAGAVTLLSARVAVGLVTRRSALSRAGR